MELTQVKGDTWVLEAGELIPLVRLSGGRCVLLDAGLGSEGEALAAALDAHRLTPVGIFASHAHRDHMGSARFLQERYGLRLCLPKGEAALCQNAALFRGGYDTFTPSELQRYYGHIFGSVDEIVGPEDGVHTFCGVPLEVIHAPGHSPDMICTRTPDGVLYLADALMSQEALVAAKLPYHYTHALARKSMERLRDTPRACAVAAHRAVLHDVGAEVDQNLQKLDQCCALLLGQVENFVMLDQLIQRMAAAQSMLTSKLEKACLYARNVRTFLEYMVDEGQVEITVRDGARFYRRMG